MKNVRIIFSTMLFIDLFKWIKHAFKLSHKHKHDHEASYISKTQQIHFTTA